MRDDPHPSNPADRQSLRTRNARREYTIPRGTLFQSEIGSPPRYRDSDSGSIRCRVRSVDGGWDDGVGTMTSQSTERAISTPAPSKFKPGPWKVFTSKN